MRQADAPDQGGRVRYASCRRGVRTINMDALGILLAAADNNGYVVLTAPPVPLLVAELLKPSHNAGAKLAYALTDKGREVLVDWRRSRSSELLQSELHHH